MIDSLNRVAGHYREMIESNGLEIKHSCDFSALEGAAHQNGNALSPHFSTSHNTFFRDEALWIGVCKDDRCVATIALKFQPLGCESLAEYSVRYWHQAYKVGSDVEILFAPRQKRFMQGLKGDLVYCGEYRVQPEYQKSGLGKWLAHYAKTITFLKWPQTTNLYIFMEDKDVRRGLLAAIEMTKQIPNALNWSQAPSQAQSDYWLAGLTSVDFCDWLDDQVKDLNAPGSKE